MEITIRQALIADAAPIAAVHVAAWRQAYTGLLEPEFIESITQERRVAQWSRALSDASPQSVFVAECERHIVGFASSGPSAHNIAPFDGELYTLYLLAEHQRGGAGTKLLAANVERLIARGFKAMLVWVLAANRNAIAFYEGLGAEYIRSAPNPVDDHADSVYGYRDLNALRALTTERLERRSLPS